MTIELGRHISLDQEAVIILMSLMKLTSKLHLILSIEIKFQEILMVHFLLI